MRSRRVRWDVVRRAKQGASYQVKDLLFQNLASGNYRVLQLCLLTHREYAEDTALPNMFLLAEANGWGNSTIEAYTGNHAGHRAIRTRLKVITAP